MSMPPNLTVYLAGAGVVRVVGTLVLVVVLVIVVVVVVQVVVVVVEVGHVDVVLGGRPGLCLDAVPGRRRKSIS